MIKIQASMVVIILHLLTSTCTAKQDIVKSLEDDNFQDRCNALYHYMDQNSLVRFRSELKFQHLKCPPYKGETLLTYALKFLKIDFSKVLLNQIPEIINTPNLKGETPLRRLIQIRDLALFELFIKKAVSLENLSKIMAMTALYGSSNQIVFLANYIIEGKMIPGWNELILHLVKNRSLVATTKLLTEFSSFPAQIHIDTKKILILLSSFHISDFFNPILRLTDYEVACRLVEILLSRNKDRLEFNKKEWTELTINSKSNVFQIIFNRVKFDKDKILQVLPKITSIKKITTIQEGYPAINLNILDENGNNIALNLALNGDIGLIPYVLPNLIASGIKVDIINHNGLNFMQILFKNKYIEQFQPHMLGDFLATLKIFRNYGIQINVHSSNEKTRSVKELFAENFDYELK